MRIMDQYHHQHEVGASTDGFLDAVNPYFDAEESAFSANDVAGTFQPEEWGTYELVAKIPAGEYPMMVMVPGRKLSTTVLIVDGQRTSVEVSFVKGDDPFVITRVQK